MLAPRQLAINAALESLFGHEINSELASIIRGWISRRSSTRRVEREEREKKKKRKKRFNDASFCMLFFRPLQRATNEQASTRFHETWLIHYSNHETWITPTSWPSRLASFWRTSDDLGFVRFFLWKKLFESI